MVTAVLRDAIVADVRVTHIQESVVVLRTGKDPSVKPVSVYITRVV